MPDLRALLIDLDGVIRHWDPENATHAEAEAGLPPGAIRRAAFSPELLTPAITGRVSDEQWRQAVQDRLRGEYPAADAALAVRLWSEPCGRVDGAALALITQCRAKARAILVTNATTRLSRDLARLGLGSAFDSVVNSSEVGSAKPDQTIFTEALRRAGVAAEAALFVDDSPANVAAASALGLHGHLHAGADDLRRTLHDHRLV